MVNQTKQNKAREKNEYSNFGYIKFLHSTVLFRGDSNKAAHHLYIDFNIGSSSKHACCRLFFIHGLFSLSPSLSAAFLIFSIDSTTQSNHFCSYRFIWRFISFFPQHRIFFFHSGLLLVHWVSFIPQTLIDNLHSSDWNVKANDRKKMQTTNGLDHVNLILSRFR